MKMFALAVVGCVTAVSSAAPFMALSYEAGGGLPGVAGAGYSVDFGGFYVNAAQGGTNVFGGSPAGFTNANEGEFDSHFSLDGFGPSVRHRSVVGGDNSNLTLSFYGDYDFGIVPENYEELDPGMIGPYGPFVSGAGVSFIAAPGSHVGDPNGDGVMPELSARAGVAVAPPPISCTHFAPNVTGGRSANNGAFVGRFTIKQGATLSGGIRFSTLVAPGDFDSRVLALGGPGVLFRTHNGPQFLSLRAYKINRAGPVSLFNPSDATADGLNEGNSFGNADVYDLWVQVVPGASVASLIAIVGSGLASRRRRS